MIIRTYQRRNRANSVNDSFRDSSSQELFWSSSQESPWSSSQEAALLSSQDSSSWSQLEMNLEDKKAGSLHKMPSEPVFKKRKQEESPSQKLQRAQSALSFGNTKESKPSKELDFKDGGDGEKAGRNNSLQRKVGFSLSRRWGFSAPPTSTLMEAQESGEMMEQVDEVNFAMDGLREGQPLRIQQASLISILSLCGSIQQRRFLRSHGIAKPLVEAVVALPTRDPPLALTAAAVLYFLSSDGHHADLLNTPACIGFLLKLTANEKNESVQAGCDGADLVAKVTAVFEKLRERNAGKNRWDDIPALDDLTSKSLALRTLEKACLSAVVLDDNTGTVTKVGGQFKERLRELGGLDAICNIAASCLANLMGKGRPVEGEGNVSMLLKCLRVMENVTFLSEDNQNYLLKMKLNNRQLDALDSFIALVIKTIETLQEIMSQENRRILITTGKEEWKAEAGAAKVVSSETSSVVRENEFSPRVYSKPSLFSKGRDVSRNPPVYNRKEIRLRNALQKAKILNSQRKVSLTSNCQKIIQVKVSDREGRFKDPKEFSLKSPGLNAHEAGTKGSSMSENSQDSGKASDDMFSQDPYDFDEVDVDYKVPLVPCKTKQQPKQSSELPKVKGSASRSGLTVDISGASVDQAAGGTTSSFQNHEETLLGECLLSAVKVLMNLTNDNAAGSQQVAACNGIDTVASLLVSNYPKGETDNSQTEQSLDLLVAVLGMLVNLVEKDESNRAQLAVLDVALPSCLMREGSVPAQGRGMIALLCSLFLSKQGSGEAAEAREGSMVSEVDEEDSVKKGQREAEDMIVEAYTALLLAFLSRDSEGARQAIAERLPKEEGLQALVPVLQRFVAFHLSLNMISAETHAAVTDVINSLKQPASK